MTQSTEDDEVGWEARLVKKVKDDRAKRAKAEALARGEGSTKQAVLRVRSQTSVRAQFIESPMSPRAVYEVKVPLEEWKSLGRPEIITVTIQPGNKRKETDDV